jgi:hypothetical protein
MFVLASTGSGADQHHSHRKKTKRVASSGAARKVASNAPTGTRVPSEDCDGFVMVCGPLCTCGCAT